jgi:phosphoribosylaminoimidazolecarboxamide formyltransferase/IMP cyclohydrolase
MELLPTNYTTDAIIGTIALNYIPSNAITFTYNGTIVGIGSGQQNRVDCIKIAGKKAMKWWNKFHTDTGKSPNFVMSSDGFLPFEDNVETANKYNVKLIIQPGGSINDKKIRNECEKYDIHMIHTGQRLFTH